MGAGLGFSVLHLRPRGAGTAQLQRIPLDGSADLAQAAALTRWRGGICDYHPLADGRTVALLAEDEPTAADERRAAEGDDAKVWGRHLPVTRLRLLDLATGAARTVDGLGDRHVVEVTQRPDGGPLAVLSWATPSSIPAPRRQDCIWSPRRREPSRTWVRSDSRPGPRSGGITTVTGTWPTWR